jgi:hypothetical protein
MRHVGMNREKSNACKITVGMYSMKGEEENEQEDLRTVGKILVY